MSRRSTASSPPSPGSGRHTRRDFLAIGGTLAGAAALGLPIEAAGAAAGPKRGGTLRFATAGDIRGLDPHRNTMSYVYHPHAATTQGLVDIDRMMRPVPGVAAEWDIAEDLLAYTFKLRKGVEYHNGRTVDAASVKWNFERISDPKIGGPFTRSSLQNVAAIDVPDATTVRVRLKEPSAVFLQNALFYPCNLIAPNSGDQAATHPIGCGPFKFVSWRRFETTVLERFENYFETGADGKPLPYVDQLIGAPRKENRVRLTALLAGEVDLIDDMAPPDWDRFATRFAADFQTWGVEQVATSFLELNLRNGPFAYSSPDSHKLRRAAAHAIDRQAIHEAIFYGQGGAATAFYSSASPWHMPEATPPPAYDPDKARALVKEAGALGTRLRLLSWQEFPYLRQTGELVQAMWVDAGFDVSHNVVPISLATQEARKGDFDAISKRNSYRIDPDGFFFRQAYSEAPMTKIRTGYRNLEVDRLLLEARRVRDEATRRQLYTRVESAINEDLPMIYLHYVPLLQAGVKSLHGYQPAVAGPFTYAGGGIRTAWLA